MKESEIIDLSRPRRKYLSKMSTQTSCPECGALLVKENCTILLEVKSETDKAQFMTNRNGSHFCKNCPVVVFDIDQIEETVKIGIRGTRNLHYHLAGIVDLKSIPDDKKHLEIGCDENPVPLVDFLPDLNTTTLVKDKFPRRNEPCPCGSGKKYKKCCGQ